MTDKQPKIKKAKIEQPNFESQLAELTLDLQRTRADFENYRKHADSDKIAARNTGKADAILKLLPIIDTIERAVTHIPEDLADNQWAQGIVSLSRNLDRAIETLGLERIDAKPGVVFDPELHDAIQIDDSTDGEKEVIDEELQAGYLLSGRPIRHAMVKVKRTN